MLKYEEIVSYIEEHIEDQTFIPNMKPVSYTHLPVFYIARALEAAPPELSVRAPAVLRNPPVTVGFPKRQSPPWPPSRT